MTFQQYQRTILTAWFALPCTRGRPSPSDRLLLRTLYAEAVPVDVVLAALILGSRRRSPNLPPIRSLAYFRPIIDEIRCADPAYIAYVIAPR